MELAAWFSLNVYVTELLGPLPFCNALASFWRGWLSDGRELCVPASLLLLTVPRDSSGEESLCRFISPSE